MILTKKDKERFAPVVWYVVCRNGMCGMWYGYMVCGMLYVYIVCMWYLLCRNGMWYVVCRNGM